MLNVSIFCGGTGSIALQTGFKDVFGYGRYRLNVIINAYDNGKSTGMCRRAFRNAILGPSDLRKNHITSFRMKYSNEVAEEGSYHERLLKLFEMRIDGDNAENYWSKAYDVLQNADFLDDAIRTELTGYVRRFIYGNWQIVKSESFKDVALSNIFYAQCAHEKGDSLSKAGTRIAEILEIEDNVHLASDISLILKARTQSGFVIKDEGEIVDWCRPDDRIVETFFIDPATGMERIPSIDEGNSFQRVQKVVKESDIIIFSSGTQWSSLIPTYAHAGFEEMIKASKAKKYLVMNNIPDKDMPEIPSNEVLDVLQQYLPLEDITVIFNDNASMEMKINDLCNAGRCISGDLGLPGFKTHNPRKLIQFIMNDYFGLRKTDVIISDLDGTMIDARGDAETRKLGEENVALFNGIILTGNTCSHVWENVKLHSAIDIYCDYGTRRVLEDHSVPIVGEEAKIEQEFIVELMMRPEFKDRIHSRNGDDFILTIKPLYHREERLKLVERLIARNGADCKAVIAGATTIDVMRSSCSKMTSLMTIMELHSLLPANIFYIGNEFRNADGNDWCIRQFGIRTYCVNGIEEFNNIIRLHRMNLVD